MNLDRHLKVIIICPECGKEKHVRPWYVKYRMKTNLCKSCAWHANRHPNWKGGRQISRGYIRIYLNVDSPFYSMATKDSYVLEHRLVMAKYLNRSLMRKEFVHHINGIKDDNRLENLQLVSLSDHRVKTELCHQCPLRKEIRLLRWEIRELKETTQLRLRDF